MGNRTIRGPGVEIIEHDLSGYTTTNLGTNCLITGFAQKGEDLEPIHITNRSSWLLNFGAPTNEAEEYFYNAGMEVLDQQGFLYAAKIPYSNDIAGIYAAAKYTISASRELYDLDEDAGMYYSWGTNELGEPEKVYREDEDELPGHPLGRFYKNYRGLKTLGLNTLQLIAPTGQDFISKDLVDEYETGESVPGSNVIYLVDKTRAVYTRATEVADKQDNRDSRYCIGIVPVITTLCNTAWFQKNSTGLESDVDELYQPVRSLRTIEFPAGAASAAEYKPTKLTKEDLHTQLMKGDGVFAASLSEQAAMIAQSCLSNGNLVDGKFKPFCCNDICVVVFKAFVSTEDGKIDFTPVETWIGSLDPEGRNEKGLTTYIDKIINDNSEYIYCFSNLQNPQKVLNPDHGFVAGSDVEYDTAKENHLNDTEYQAATLFSAYAAAMLGFNKGEQEDDGTGLPAPRDWSDEVYGETWDEDNGKGMKDYSYQTMGNLRKYYNEDAKQTICTLDPFVMGAKFSFDDLIGMVKDATDDGIDSTTGEKKTPNYLDGYAGDYIEKIKDEWNEYLDVAEKFITEPPAITYKITRKGTKVVDGETVEVEQEDGDILFDLYRLENLEKPENFELDSYEYKFEMGKKDEEVDYYGLDGMGNKIAEMKLSELSIFNSTDYLRSIYDFDELVNPDVLAPGVDDFDSVEWAEARQKAIQAMIVNSIQKSGRFKAKLRYLKKAKINLDRLDMNFDWACQNISSNSTNEQKANKAIGKKYVEDIFKSYDDVGLLGGIKFVELKEEASTSPSDESRDILGKKDALEAKLDEIVNIDTTKKEKMKPRKGKDDGKKTKSPELIFAEKYLRVRQYLLSQYYAKLGDMLKVIAKTMEDCTYAQQRYVESQRNIDDANIMLGFYPEMAEPIITYTTIAQSLNKIFDSMKNVHDCDIDVVCDAGVSNIAQFVKQVYDPSADDGEDVGGIYQPVKYSAYFKFNKNTDLAYWKTIVFKFDTFCKYRGDCMFCTEGPRGMVLIGNKQVVRKTKKDTSVDLNILPYLKKITGFNTSYGAGYLNWYRTISDYTGDTLWIPPSIKAMGTYILTDKQYNWWDAPAGMRRGVINMVETSFNPNKDQAGDIYDANWNYAIHYVNDGIIQEGQKTFQTRQSALDRVNVRRLIGRIKRYVYFASRQFLYEPHTAAIREKYVKTITPFFQDLVNRGGLYGFKIICDESNNTPEVIDRNELRVKIGIKPVKTIEFIIIDLCTLNTGASWTEMDSV